MSYVVHLDQFEGPLDLLLHLIRQAKIDIKDIFISKITEQYLDVVRRAEELDMEVSGEFITMAAALIEFKSRALLPKLKTAEEEYEDSEQALIDRITLYQYIKDVSDDMRLLEERGSQNYYKLPDELVPPDPVLDLEGVGAEDLFHVLSTVLQRKLEPERPKAPPVHHVRRDTYTVSERMRHLSYLIKNKKRILFETLFEEDCTREEVVVTFIAMLELMRQGRVRIMQRDAFGTIDIRWRAA
jgi:segregation and condensation protein A